MLEHVTTNPRRALAVLRRIDVLHQLPRDDASTTFHPCHEDRETEVTVAQQATGRMQSPQRFLQCVRQHLGSEQNGALVLPPSEDTQ